MDAPDCYAHLPRPVMPRVAAQKLLLSQKEFLGSNPRHDGPGQVGIAIRGIHGRTSLVVRGLGRRPVDDRTWTLPQPASVQEHSLPVRPYTGEPPRRNAA